MDAIEMRARELFAEQLEADHRTFSARMIRSGQVNLGADYAAALRAIKAALTPPEGYVLVPEQLPVEMEVAFMEAWTSKRRCTDAPEMQDAWSAALAARPEVP